MYVKNGSKDLQNTHKSAAKFGTPYYYSSTLICRSLTRCGTEAAREGAPLACIGEEVNGNGTGGTSR